MFNDKHTDRMKRFHWRYAVIAPVVALGMIACETPDDKDEPGGNYPSNNLTVQETQQIGMTEITAVDCGNCLATQLAMEIAKARYPGRIIPMSLHAGDTLYTPFQNDLYLTLGDDMSNTFKLFINGFQVPQGVDPLEQIQIMIESETPPSMGVAHATRENDTAWLIYPKVKLYVDNQLDYYVQSYVMLDNAIAKQYGAIDLTQASSLAELQAGGGGAPSVWTQNVGEVDSVTYLYSQGDPYMHHDVALYAGVNDTNVYGLPLSTINPLGQNFFVGDIFGNEFTPIEIAVPKPDFDLIDHVDGEIKVATVVWQRIPGTPDVYVFVNGYYSEF